MGTYDYNGKKYDTGKLRTSLDREFDSFVSSLKDGRKHYQQYYDAYNNMMKGLEDGSIRFSDGQFVDSKNRYSNNVYYDSTGKKIDAGKNDYYGTVARYMLNGMAWQPEYSDPSKTRWSNHALTDRFKKTFFGAGNSDALNLKLFHGLDIAKEGGAPTTAANRTARLGQFFQDLYDNFDNVFSGYTDDEKAQALADIRKAQESIISGGGLTQDEYLDVSKALPGMDIYKLMYTGDTPYEDKNKPPTIEDFAAYYDKTAVKSRGTARSIQLAPTTLTDTQVQQLSQALTNSWNADNGQQTLRQLMLQAINDPSKSLPIKGTNISSSDFLRGMFTVFKTNQSLYYDNPENNRTEARFLDPDNMGYSLDGDTLYISPASELGWYQNKMYDQWKGTLHGSNVKPWMYRYFQRQQTPSARQGAILKYQNAGRVYSNVDKSADADFTGQMDKTLQHVYDTIKRFRELEKQHPELKTTGTEHPGLVDSYINFLHERQKAHSVLKTKYANDKDFKQPLTPDADVQEYQKIYHDRKADPEGFVFTTPNGNITEWGEKGELNQDDLGYNQFLDEKNYAPRSTSPISGDNKKSGFQDDGLWGRTSWSRVYLGNDDLMSKEQVGRWQTKFRDELDLDYKYLDGVDGYYGLTPIKKDTAPKANPVQEKQEKPTPESKVKPNNPQQESPMDMSWQKGLTLPELTEIGRLINSLAFNEKIGDRLQEGIMPVLKDPFELYSPVTGAFSLMQFKNNQAADTRFQATQPVTSDASLMLARQNEADREARKLETEGFLIDDATVDKTRREALQRQEKNIQMRNAVAMMNRQELADVQKERSEIDARKYGANWAGVDEYLKGVTTRAQEKIDEDKALNRYLGSYISDARYDMTMDDLMERFRTAYPGMTDEAIQELPEYQKQARSAGLTAQKEKYATLSGGRYAHGMDDIKSYIAYIKNGGAMQLISKVIHENTKA